jgi:1-phosphofructokinase family hexose kinase
MSENVPYPPITTLTLNPSVDVCYTFPGLIADQKVHASQTRYDPGGNGINVARGLRALGIHSRVCLITAGETGSLLERLLAHHVDEQYAVHVDGGTRVNCTLIQQQPRVQYEVDGIGPHVTTEALDEISGTFLRSSEKGIGVLTGSLPPGVPRDIYAQLVRFLRERKARAVVDAQSPILQATLQENPYLIKPNRYELEMLCGRKLPGLEDVIEEAKKIQRSGVEHVCVSLGARGALLVESDGVYHSEAPQVPIISTVGAGDTMVAGLICGLVRGEDPSQILRMGIACGTATAAKPGTDIFTEHEMMAVLDQIKVRKLE